MNATSNLHSVSLQSLNLRRQQDLETLTGIILSWNSSRLDLFELSLPNENLEFSGHLFSGAAGYLLGLHVLIFRSDAVLLPAS